MNKSNSAQIPFILSLSQNSEDKKLDGDILISLKSKEASLTQSINKNTPVKTTTMTIKEFKEYDQELDIRDDPIFMRICDKNNYSDTAECELCKNAFGIFKSRKNCGFCGKAVCKSHLVKKRESPQNPAVFLKICEICEEKYLNKMILDDFFKKKKKKKKKRG